MGDRRFRPRPSPRRNHAGRVQAQGPGFSIAALEPKKIKSDRFGTPPLGTPGFDWDGSISINTYTDYDTKHGPFTIHKYHEEWDSGTSIYATDEVNGKDLMGRIVECMRASGRYRGSLFDNDGERDGMRTVLGSGRRASPRD